MALRAVGGSGATAPLTLASGTITADSPALTLTQTWNNGAVSFTGYKVNITNTASANGSKLADFQIGGTTIVAIHKNGVFSNTDETNGFSVSGTVLTGKTGGNESYRLQANRITGTSGTVFGLTSSSTSADGGNVDTGQARKAAKVWEFNDGTAGSYAGTAFGSGSQTVAQLPSAATAGKGARSFVTDATATTFLSTVSGGGANNVPVVSDGTNWLIG
jgi:hypothetical protein